VDARLLETAARQDGLLTRAQLSAGGRLGLLRCRLRNGEWVEEQPGVVRPAVLLPSFAVRVRAVALALGTDSNAPPWIFSHQTAAHLLGLPVAEPSRVDVLLPAANRDAPLTDVHRRITKKRPRRVWCAGNPVTWVADVALQCAAELERDDLLELVEFALRTRRTTLAKLRASCGRGVAGSASLRDVWAELSAEGIDRWMRRLVRLLCAAGLPKPTLEAPIFDGAHRRALLDGLWEALQLALEVDDWETHGSRDAQERDRQRDRWLLREHGITTVRVTPREIRDRPDDVVRDIVAAYERCGGTVDEVRPKPQAERLSRT
jgi:hypothetical protein